MQLLIVYLECSSFPVCALIAKLEQESGGTLSTRQLQRGYQESLKVMDDLHGGSLAFLDDS